MTARGFVATVLTASIAACLPVAAADGAVKRGTFRGTTSEADPIGFKVDRKGRVHSLFFEAVTLACSDGDTFETPQGAKRVQTPQGKRFRVVSNAFGITATGTAGFGWDLDGAFKGKASRATGTLTITARFNEDNKQDANGSVTCESRPLTWSARRRA